MCVVASWRRGARSPLGVARSGAALAGAAIAVGIAYILRGRADSGGAAAAQGDLGKLEVRTPSA